MSTPTDAHLNSFSTPVLTPYERGFIHGLSAGALLILVLILPPAMKRDAIEAERQAIAKWAREEREKWTVEDSGKEEKGSKTPTFLDEGGE